MNILRMYYSLNNHIYKFFLFSNTATPEIYTLSLHDALPIFRPIPEGLARSPIPDRVDEATRSRHGGDLGLEDRKSTRLNSSHRTNSYAVFCLKKKKSRPPLRCLIC